MREPFQKYPDDACIIARPPWWKIHYSPSEKKIYLDSTEYNSGPLGLTRDDLVWLLEVMDNWSGEYKERILSWLEKNAADDWTLQFEILMARSGSRKGLKLEFRGFEPRDPANPKEDRPEKT
ncbi:MAG: hypothetical protein K6U03_00745 [Firmicutes bacterium]|nr:hypothetical protein [Bacillota bacterium]